MYLEYLGSLYCLLWSLLPPLWVGESEGVREFHREGVSTFSLLSAPFPPLLCFSTPILLYSFLPSFSSSIYSSSSLTLLLSLLFSIPFLSPPSPHLFLCAVLHVILWALAHHWTNPGRVMIWNNDSTTLTVHCQPQDLNIPYNRKIWWGI